MRKILLINPGYESNHELYKHKSLKTVHRDSPPVALLYLGSYLSENGYDIDIVDTHLEDDYVELIREKIKANNYIFVGITVFIGRFLKNAGEITRLINNVKISLPVVWGGIMPSIMPEACLREYRPDFIVRFEGEKICLELAKAIENKVGIADINGISYLKGDQIINNPASHPVQNLDDLPIPKWELFGQYFNNEQLPYYFQIMSSKGCPFNCKFCYKHSVDVAVRSEISPWRCRSAQHIIKEIEYIHQKTGARVFTFGDDNFLINKTRVLEILDYFRLQGFYIEECIGHINCLNDELINAMAGIVQTFIFSVETASSRLQKYIDKQVDLVSVPAKARKLYEKGIVSNISFIIGLPTEINEDLRANIDFMIKLKGIGPFIRGNSYFFLPLPKTRLYDVVEKLYDVKLPISMVDFEDANFWVKDIEDPVGKKFRPWLSDEQFQFLVHYGLVFNDVFKANNSKINETTRDILGSNHKIRKMFRGVESISHPKTDYRPYILDRLLRGAPINLVADLRDK